MKKTAFAVLVSVLTVLIVLPAIRCVNHAASCIVADGSPQPVPLPPALDLWTTTGESLIVDGSPQPVPLPPALDLWTTSGKSLIADGSPQPVPLPPASFVV